MRKKIINFLTQERYTHTAKLHMTFLSFTVFLTYLMLMPKISYFLSTENIFHDFSLDFIKVSPDMFLYLVKAFNTNLNFLFLYFTLFFSIITMRFTNFAVGRILLIFFHVNLYYFLWPLQDGGNNLAMLLLFMSLLTLPSCVEFKIFKFSKNQKDSLRNLGNNLFIWLCRIQITIMYFEAFISKVQGAKWRHGTVLYYVSQSDYYGVEWFAKMLAKHPELSTIGTWAGILFQMLFVFYWTNRKLRPWLLAFGSLFHLSIAITMNLWIFSISMILFYACFLTDEQARKIIDYVYPKNKLIVAFDEDCKICQKFAKFVSKFSSSIEIDKARYPKNTLLKNIPFSERIKSIKAIHKNQKIEGWEVIDQCLRRTYFGFLFIPVNLILTATKCGHKIYAKVSNSEKLNRCRDNVCSR